MEINRTGRTESPSVRRVAKQSGTADNVFQIASAEPSRAPAVSGPGPIAAVEGILTLQGLDDSTSGLQRPCPRRASARHARRGSRWPAMRRIPRATLNRLAIAVGRRHETFADPSLQTVLDEIELRARVELAKLEQVDRLAG